MQAAYLFDAQGRLMMIRASSSQGPYTYLDGLKFDVAGRIVTVG